MVEVMKIMVTSFQRSLYFILKWQWLGIEFQAGNSLRILFLVMPCHMRALP